MGVQVEVVEAGGGTRKPKHGEVVHCHYTGRLEDGTVFDSSVSRGKPLTFLIGIGAVIKGWDEVRPRRDGTGHSPHQS
jgi:FKBP-type peptidyl-prolyl cis-trans isomerase